MENMLVTDQKHLTWCPFTSNLHQSIYIYQLSCRNFSDCDSTMILFQISRNVSYYEHFCVYWKKAIEKHVYIEILLRQIAFLKTNSMSFLDHWATFLLSCLNSSLKYSWNLLQYGLQAIFGNFAESFWFNTLGSRKEGSFKKDSRTGYFIGSPSHGWRDESFKQEVRRNGKF